MANNYDDLLSGLRDYAAYLKSWGEDHRAALLHEAADAIEELSKDLERSKEWEMFWEEAANEAAKKFHTTVASKPHWIPVTERLPQEDPVGSTVLCALKKKRTGFRWIDLRLFMDGKFHHPKHQKGQVTHWMTLPKLPKEET